MEGEPDLVETVANLFRESDERVMEIFNKIWELIRE